MSSIIFMCGDWNALTPAERKAATVPRITTQTEEQLGAIGASLVDVVAPNMDQDVVIFCNVEAVFMGFRRALCDSEDRTAYARSKLVYVDSKGRHETGFHPNGSPIQSWYKGFDYVIHTTDYLLTKNGRPNK